MTGLGKRTQSGFTLVEVMIAIGVMTVGSLGILAMHQGVVYANRSAHEMNTAMAIAEGWVQRVERDALSWTQRGPATAELSGTNYLSGLASTTTTTGWFRPAPIDPAESYGFNHFGDDIDTGLGEVPKYCTNVRASWLRAGSSARVDIRVFWYREGQMAGNAQHPDWVGGSAFRSANCGATDADTWGLDAAPLPPNVDVIFASTVVTWLRREGT